MCKYFVNCCLNAGPLWASTPQITDFLADSADWEIRVLHRLTVYATRDTCHRLTVYATGPHFYLSRVKTLHTQITHTSMAFFNAFHSIRAVPTHLPTPYPPSRGRYVPRLSLQEFRSPDGILPCRLRLQIGTDSGCNRFFGHLLT